MEKRLRELLKSLQEKKVEPTPEKPSVESTIMDAIKRITKWQMIPR